MTPEEVKHLSKYLSYGIEGISIQKVQAYRRYKHYDETVDVRFHQLPFVAFQLVHNIKQKPTQLDHSKLVIASKHFFRSAFSAVAAEVLCARNEGEVVCAYLDCLCAST